MFKEILKIIPKLDNGDLNKMERSLGSRFKRISKKFGKGLVGAIKGGGLLGAGLAIITKILNPLKEVQETVDNQLRVSDEISTFAKQFNTDSGKLFKLIKYAEASGLDQTSLLQALQKFQTKVAQATANPEQPSAVRQYAGRTDTAEAFFEYIQNLQKLNTNDRAFANFQLFGEDFVLKLSEFLQQDFKKLTGDLGLKDSSAYTGVIEKGGNLENLSALLTARRTARDFETKGSLLNENMVRSKDRQERIRLQRENQKLASYESLANISEGTDKIIGIIEKGFLTLTKMLDKLTGLTTTIRKLGESRLFKGIGGLFGGDN